MAEETPSRTIASRTEYRSIRSYTGVGFLLLFLLLCCVALAYLGYVSLVGPSLFAVEDAVRGLALVCLVLAIGLFYVLFTLRSNLKTVRGQATDLALMRTRMHEHVDTRVAPSPVIEYRSQVAAAPSRSVIILEGIGPAFGARLERAGIETLRDLRAASIDEIIQACEVPAMTAIRWKCMADLMVARDLDPQAAELLVRCGIVSIDQLARQDEAALFEKARRTNTEQGARVVPNDVTKDMARNWIRSARIHGGATAT